MRKNNINQILVTTLLVLALVLVLPIVVRAQESPEKMPPSETPVVNQIEGEDGGVSGEVRLREFRERQLEVRRKIEQNKENREAKLEAKKLEVCKKHEEKINNLMSRMSDRGDKRLELFNKISDKIKTFYNDKQLSISNYDELVASVDAAKLVAEDAVNDTKSTSITFKCDGTDPRGASEYFKANLESQSEAMKDYRTALKNLITAVKSAYETANPTSEQENQ